MGYRDALYHREGSPWEGWKRGEISAMAYVNMEICCK